MLLNWRNLLELHWVQISHDFLQSKQVLEIYVQHLAIVFSEGKHHLHNHVYFERPDTCVSSSYASQHQKSRWFWQDLRQLSVAPSNFHRIS